jgi:Rrf2 family nitric oxide-sensitive transcriptional repressor
MRLTLYTDYSLRVLIYLAAHDDRMCSIAEIAKAHRISYSHLMKVVNALAHHGFVETVRGRGGGLKLAKAPSAIGVGDVVRKTEEGMNLVDCDNCVIVSACGLTPVFRKGVAAMMSVFDDYTVADLIAKRKQLAAALSAA